MATTTRRKTQTELGLGWRHRQAADALRRAHQDGAPCSWCGRPMYLDRTKNWDYNPDSTNPDSGKLHAHHGKMSRAEAIKLGVPIPLPDELLHGACNIQLGDGGNKHLAASANPEPSTPDTLAMPWPWPTAHIP
ncbi:hypothetical protein [Mycobacterium malmoense]|uniref:hypothetical protein n=1 Tax=Mycobacterium malmoense TaxID=1780 RepID=UPI0008F91CCD|nr:hypothetical protein [Mycobacterium malmoense]OIN79336.1 hypothetical protein BMG05_18280 [Mycobacterium malmoense]